MTIHRTLLVQEWCHASVNHSIQRYTNAMQIQANTHTHTHTHTCSNYQTNTLFSHTKRHTHTHTHMKLPHRKEEERCAKGKEITVTIKYPGPTIQRTLETWKNLLLVNLGTPFLSLSLSVLHTHPVEGVTYGESSQKQRIQVKHMTAVFQAYVLEHQVI